MINVRPLVMTSTDEVPLIYVEIVWYPKISSNEVYIIISYWNLIKQGKCNLEQPINFINDKIKNGYLNDYYRNNLLPEVAFSTVLHLN
jgi:hypothetical protein